MATIIEALALSGSRKGDGTVNAGGRVFLTRPGSASVLVTGYLDRDASAATTLDGGGYLLDGAGKIALFIEDPCDVRIEDADGVTVDSFGAEPSTSAGLVEVVNAGFTGVDPVSGALVAGGRSYLDAVLSSLKTSLGGTDGKFRGTYGTVDTNVKDEIERLNLTPQRFGAKGDGVTDDTAAFALMAQAQAASQIPIFIPKGTYQLSSETVFTQRALIRGAGINAVLRGTNGTMNCLRFTQIFNTIETLHITHAATSTGSVISCVGGMALNGVTTSNAKYAYGANDTLGAVRNTANNCDLFGSTAGTVGEWYLTGSTADSVKGARSYFGAVTVSASGEVFATTTADMANGGSTVPTVGGVGQVIAYQRIRGTSAGGGAVAATAAQTNTKILILDLYNNSGGAFLFTMNAQYKNSGNPNPANGSRVCMALAWNPTEAVWVAMGRETST